jgi:VWFA-related protein
MSARRPVVAAILASALLALGAVAVRAGSTPSEAAAGPATPSTFEESIDVSLVSSVLRVVDIGGNPILGLVPADLVARIGKREIPIVGLDWVGADGGGAADAATAALAIAGWADSGEIAPPPSPGRLVVIFVQADLNPTRISGQLRLRPYTRDLLAALAPEDRVAVVSFDSHLKLWQDFTRDAEATHTAIDRAMLFSDEVEITPTQAVSLARNFSAAVARQVASPERALEVLGQALQPLPGEKIVLFLGWGLGRFDAAGVRMTPAFQPAARALRAAHASVFVLDVTSADEHSLAVGLESIAAATGGLYFSTFRLPGLATRTLARAISGYYVLTLDRSAAAAGEGSLRIELRTRVGTVLARPVVVKKASGS